MLYVEPSVHVSLILMNVTILRKTYTCMCSVTAFYAVCYHSDRIFIVTYLGNVRLKPRSDVLCFIKFLLLLNSNVSELFFM